MNSLMAVFVYEWRRSLSLGRIAWWGAMAVFPIVIVLLLRSIPNFEKGMKPDEFNVFWSILMYVLVPCVCSALSVLLTAGPAVASELEQRSWVYLATRPNGIFWLLLGKYCVAVTWGVSAAWTGISLAIPFTNSTAPFHIWGTILALSLLSCLGYSALYMLIGALFPKRAMLFSVMYTGFVEVVLGLIPAVINRLTIQFRLRSLLVKWGPTNVEMERMDAFEYVFGTGSPLLHCLWLAALTAVFLAAALVVAHRKEFTTAAEGDL